MGQRDYKNKPSFQPMHRTNVEAQRRTADRALSALRKDMRRNRDKIVETTELLAEARKAEELQIDELGKLLDALDGAKRQVYNLWMQRELSEVSLTHGKPFFSYHGKLGREFTVDDAIDMVRKQAPQRLTELGIELALEELRTHPNAFEEAGKLLTRITNEVAQMMMEDE